MSLKDDSLQPPLPRDHPLPLPTPPMMNAIGVCQLNFPLLALLARQLLGQRVSFLYLFFFSLEHTSHFLFFPVFVFISHLSGTNLNFFLFPIPEVNLAGILNYENAGTLSYVPTFCLVYARGFLCAV